MTDTSHPDLHRRVGRADRVFGWSALGAGALILVVLALITLTMTGRSVDVIRHEGLDFLTSKRWAPADDRFGALAFIYGTLVSATIAIALAVPVSVGIALLITQVLPERARKPVIYVVDLLAVVPSVVFGLWGVLVFSEQAVGFYEKLHAWFGDVPLLGRFLGVPAGRSFFTAGVILAIMITPIVTSLAREVIDTTPRQDREGALALGATTWEMIRGAVLPHAKGGLVGAVMLGLGRAMGETIAAALVIGSSAQVTANLLGAGDNMPAVIANQWGEADGLHKSGLVALAMTLFVITIVVNMAASAVVNRSMRRTRGNR